MTNADRAPPSPSDLRTRRLAEIETLHQVMAAFANPHALKPGDLVQMRRILIPPDADLDNAAIGIVLSVIEDLGAITGDGTEKGLPGLRLARSVEDGLDHEMSCDPLWWFEPYSGPRPDAH